jgi:hypothetical protein
MQRQVVEYEYVLKQCGRKRPEAVCAHLLRGTWESMKHISRNSWFMFRNTNP